MDTGSPIIVVCFTLFSKNGDFKRISSLVYLADAYRRSAEISIGWKQEELNDNRSFAIDPPKIEFGMDYRKKYDRSSIGSPVEKVVTIRWNTQKRKLYERKMGLRETL